MSRSYADRLRSDNDSDYGRHVTELRRRARRPDTKQYNGRANRKQAAIKQNLKDNR